MLLRFWKLFIILILFQYLQDELSILILQLFTVIKTKILWGESFMETCQRYFDNRI